MGFFSKKPPSDTRKACMILAEQLVAGASAINKKKRLRTQYGNYDFSDRSVASQINQSLNKLLPDADSNTSSLNGLRDELLNQVEQGVDDPPDIGALYVWNFISNFNFICETFYDYPNYSSLNEMVNNLTKLVCPAIANMLGPDLPSRVHQHYPAFSKVFSETMEADGLFKLFLIDNENKEYS